MTYYSDTSTDDDKCDVDYVNSIAIKNYRQIGRIMCFKPEEAVRYCPYTMQVPILHRDFSVSKRKKLLLATPLLKVQFPPEKGKISFNMTDMKRKM